MFETGARYVEDWGPSPVLSRRVILSGGVITCMVSVVVCGVMSGVVVAVTIRYVFMKLSPVVLNDRGGGSVVLSERGGGSTVELDRRGPVCK